MVGPKNLKYGEDQEEYRKNQEKIRKNKGQIREKNQKILKILKKIAKKPFFFAKNLKNSPSASPLLLLPTLPASLLPIISVLFQQFWQKLSKKLGIPVIFGEIRTSEKSQKITMF